jgi:hypothetical protein
MRRSARLAKGTSGVILELIDNRFVSKDYSPHFS